jgi:uncharacterized ParB-like nuclease family protein
MLGGAAATGAQVGASTSGSPASVAVAGSSLAREQARDLELGPVGVLVFVDHDVAPAVLALGCGRSRSLQQAGGQQQQVVEVDRVPALRSEAA